VQKQRDLHKFVQSIWTTASLNNAVMATALQGFRLTARSCQCRPHAHRYLTKSIGRRRAFSTTQHLLADSDSSNPPSTKRSTQKPSFDKLAAWIRPDNEEDLEGLARIRTLAERPELEDEVHEVEQVLVDDIGDYMKVGGFEPAQAPRKKKLKNTFLNMGDPEPFEDDDFELEADTYEEMSSLAHGELEHHREMRHYARLAAWEMPLLSSMLL
jgi:small subunit ribosomal protein S35